MADLDFTFGGDVDPLLFASSEAQEAVQKIAAEIRALQEQAERSRPPIYDLAKHFELLADESQKTNFALESQADRLLRVKDAADKTSQSIYNLEQHQIRQQRATLFADPNFGRANMAGVSDRSLRGGLQGVLAGGPAQGVNTWGGLLKGLNDDTDTFIQKQNQAGRALGGFQGNARRGVAALLELSRGAEDAAIMYGTQGLSGAMRGATNNIAQMATIMSPMAGVIAGFGGAIASIVIPKLIEAAENTKTWREELEEAVNSWNGLRAVEIDIGARRFRDPEEERDIDEVRADVRRTQFEERNAFDIQAVREQQLSDALALGGISPEFSREFIDNIFSTDPRIGGSRIPWMQRVAESQGSSLDLSDAQIDAIRNAEIALQESRMGRQGLVVDLNDLRLEQEGARERAIEGVEDLVADLFGQIKKGAKEGVEKAHKDMVGFFEDLVADIDPDRKHGQELADRLEKLAKYLPEGSEEYETVAQIMRDDAMRDQEKDVKERVEKTERQTVSGAIVGIEELNRRISESAASLKGVDPVKEAVDNARTQAQKAEEERKRQAEVQIEQLREAVKHLSHIDQEKVFGVLAP